MAQTAERSGRANGRFAASPFHLYDDAMAIAGSLLRGPKQAGAQQISQFAEAARDAARAITDTPAAQHYATAAAHQLDLLSDYVARTNLEQMTTDVSVFARRHPYAMLGLSIAAGFALSRGVDPSMFTVSTQMGRRKLKARKVRKARKS